MTEQSLHRRIWTGRASLLNVAPVQVEQAIAHLEWQPVGPKASAGEPQAAMPCQLVIEHNLQVTHYGWCDDFPPLNLCELRSEFPNGVAPRPFFGHWSGGAFDRLGLLLEQRPDPITNPTPRKLPGMRQASPMPRKGIRTRKTSARTSNLRPACISPAQPSLPSAQPPYEEATRANQHTGKTATPFAASQP